MPLVELLPFGNTLETVTLTGAQLEALLEQQFTHASVGNRLQVSRGFHYAFDPAECKCDEKVFTARQFEDYVGDKGTRVAALLAVKFAFAVAAVIGVLAVLRIASGVAA